MHCWLLPKIYSLPTSITLLIHCPTFVSTSHLLGGSVIQQHSEQLRVLKFARESFFYLMTDWSMFIFFSRLLTLLVVCLLSFFFIQKHKILYWYLLSALKMLRSTTACGEHIPNKAFSHFIERAAGEKKIFMHDPVARRGWSSVCPAKWGWVFQDMRRTSFWYLFFSPYPFEGLCLELQNHGVGRNL